MTRLPFPDSAAAFESFSRCFPPDIHPGTNHGTFLDTHRNPFGFLTKSGLLQLSENGRRFFNRYNHHGHHLPERKRWRHEYAEDFLSVWDVKVYSTNYLRTIMSVQSFLDGLLGTHCYSAIAERSHDPTINKELRVPHHGWQRPDYGEAELTRICVRDVRHDPLNAFDRNPDLMAELVGDVMTSEAFRAKDGTAIPLATRLASVLPGLIRPRRADLSARSPSGINWVEAADHFVCRKAHGVGYAKFTDYDDDDRVEQTLSAMSHQTLAHLAWRFRQWYMNKRLLAAVAAPPLREITEQMERTPMLGVNDKRPFVIYSCHDVTILGLLYGIGADFLADELSNEWRFWPQYGSTLAFELVRIVDGVGTSDTDSHVVRILLNGVPVRSVEFDPERRLKIPVGHGPEEMMWIHDFADMVTQLEEEGGLDYASLLHLK